MAYACICHFFVVNLQPDYVFSYKKHAPGDI